jgi:dienelactone hydrolase
LWSPVARAGSQEIFGPYGPEGPRLREQLWILPSGDPDRFLRATVFRPESTDAATARRPLVVINHGTSDTTRLAVSMPVYYWLSRWFVERGYVVVLPQRRGHGATGGPLVESIGSCSDPDHLDSGQVGADDIEAVVSYMAQQPFVQPDETVVVGISTGGWASLALASRNPPSVRAIVNFAGGRGGHAGGMPNAVCGQQRLIDAARAYGSTARVPTFWLYASNDSYFGPDLAKSMAAAWDDAGGLVDLDLLPPYGSDGHEVADDRAGWDIWGPALERFLAAHSEPAVVAARPVSPEDAAPEPVESVVSPASLTVGDPAAAADNR